jgi:lon-related putative ATP-dependent protease
LKKKTPTKKAPSRAPKASVTALPKPLTAEQTFSSCPVNLFKFKSTKNIEESHDIIAQDRAIAAINMGLGIRRPGYNIYVAGIQGTGKTSVIRQFLEQWAVEAPPPNDWLYLHNFNAPECPQAVEMPRGQAKVFKKKMDHIVKTFKAEIPSALQSEDYENAINAYLSAANERKTKLFTELEKLAKSMDFTIKSTRMGIETIPVVDGRPLTDKEYNKLSDDTRLKIEAQRARLEPEVLDFARKVRAIEEETKEYVESLRREIGSRIISKLIDPLLAEFEYHKEIVEYLGAVKENIIENLLDFINNDPKEEDPMEEKRDFFTPYKVNVFVDNSQTTHAPVIIESNPTYYNLFGKVEKNVEHGVYRTDLTMIKNGSIHKANGGYLVLNILDIFRNPQIWDVLKRVLRNRKAFIEDMGEYYSLLPTSGLRPTPIPLDIKVVLIGTDEIYHILYQEDEEFHKIFKIKADFDFKMKRSAANINNYVKFIATRTKVENLLPFDPSGIASIIEFSSRLVEDQQMLSTQFGEIKDLTIEADFIARQKKSSIIKREFVEEALAHKFYRLNLHEENLHDAIRHNDILISVDGSRVGQINGLAVYDYGDYSFGKPGRITCTTSIRDRGIINIERSSHLSGRIHDKGVMILSGFIHALLAKDFELGLSASICFEQSYGMIDGDSASCAELLAILSAMSGIPIKQQFAITGSINQLGEIQPIGGVNEKIEGFHKTCKSIGKSREYGCIIPYQNVRNLMLHRSVRDAIDKGEFKIYPVAHVWQAFEIITGVPLGAKSLDATTPPSPGSALELIMKKLDKIRENEYMGEDSRNTKKKSRESYEKWPHSINTRS